MRHVETQTKRAAALAGQRSLRDFASVFQSVLALITTAACADASFAKDEQVLSDAGPREQASRPAAEGGASAAGAASVAPAMPSRSCSQPAACMDASVGSMAPQRARAPMGARGTSTIPASDSDAGESDTAMSEEAAGASMAGNGDVAAPVFATVELDEGTSLPQLGNGDLWTSCWSDDDALYTAAGDGTGFGLLFNDVFIARIDGRPGEPDYRGTQLAVGAQVSDIWSGSDMYTRKPTGMLCLNGELYLAVQDLSMKFDDAPAATIVHSTNKGRTWSWDRSAPMFAGGELTTIMFLDFGKDSEHAPSDYVYAYGLDGNWAFSEGMPGPTRMYLARVDKAHVLTRAAWEFFAGYAADGTPRFDANIAARQPVLEDTRRVCAMPLDPKLRFQNMTTVNQGGVVYNAPLRRYIYSSWTEYTIELYEAPEPWGPFKLFYSKDFGVWPWDANQNGGYATTIPSKFISKDGKDMLLQANSWESDTGKNNYAFSLRKLHVEPPEPSIRDNQRGGMSLATTSAGAVRLSRALRHGHAEVMNDGDVQRASEDSYNGEAKQEDYWGYTWAEALHINTLRYTTGEQSAQGGNFETLTVQMRRGDAWVDVPLENVEPQSPADGNVKPFTTYTLSFADVVTNGIRIFGRPGGSDHYTSIAELSVHFE